VYDVSPIRILLVEDNPGDALLLHEALADVSSAHFDLIQVARLGDALHRLEHEQIDVVLLDLSLPDSQGVDTFFTLHAHYARIPIIVLTSLTDDTFALRVVASGGQDYLVKGQIDGATLVRAMRYAIERHRIQLELHTLSSTDDLTGLYNRRGFFAHATQYMKLAHRSHREFLVIYADLDGLKRINDTLGHDAGSQALRDTAQVLRATFRESDIISRFGGDEFVILMLDADHDNVECIAGRLQANVACHNQAARHPYELSLSVGIIPFDPDGGMTLEAAITRADEAMYLQKRNRQRARGA
jgi:diguanylate cyclase (GGDEF)-like protein